MQNPVDIGQLNVHIRVCHDVSGISDFRMRQSTTPDLRAAYGGFNEVAYGSAIPRLAGRLFEQPAIRGQRVQEQRSERRDAAVSDLLR